MNGGNLLFSVCSERCGYSSIPVSEAIPNATAQDVGLASLQRPPPIKSSNQKSQATAHRTDAVL
ncbi:MAG: hypothetical protein ACI8TX_002308 [Hyphomicrobiaceae bacterium]|jgi:hypothetical protein